MGTTLYRRFTEVFHSLKFTLYKFTRLFLDKTKILIYLSYHQSLRPKDFHPPLAEIGHFLSVLPLFLHFPSYQKEIKDTIPPQMKEGVFVLLPQFQYINPGNSLYSLKSMCSCFSYAFPTAGVALPLLAHPSPSLLSSTSPSHTLQNILEIARGFGEFLVLDCTLITPKLWNWGLEKSPR